MIKITRLNNTSFYLNSELIETVEATPDTVITTIEGKKYIVSEPVEKVIELILDYKASVLRRAQQPVDCDMK